MTEEVFINQYWKQYLMIEKEFKSTIKYVAIDKSNFIAYSDTYAKILLQIGSEIDIVAKELCTEINPQSNAHKIDQYNVIVLSRFSEFKDVTVSIGDMDFQPWKAWDNASPGWWSIYNGIKHNRHGVETHGGISQENYKFANQETVLNALAGLYQLEIYLYSITNHNPDVETPLPGSRLFRLKDQGWGKRKFGKDILFYLNDKGYLVYSEGAFTYHDV